MQMRPKVFPFILHLIGDGKGAKFWTDPWLSVGQLMDVYGARVVSDLGLGLRR